MNSESFVHLHVHTEYSMLDGAAKVKPLFAEAERLGMPALGITDHGNMFGSFEFYQNSREFAVKPIIGIEAYLAPKTRHHKKPTFWGSPDQRADDVAGSGAYTHMTLLAENASGLRNLFRLSSIASIDGYYYKPRMDRELLAQYSNGILATTGCPSGEIQTRLRLGQSREALESAAEYRDIFGSDNFFLELMDHGLSIENRVRDGLLEIGRKLALRPLATNDSHYVRQVDAKAHEVLLCIQSGKTLSDPKRFKFDGDGYYLKSPTEMRDLWDGQVSGACETSLLIAERVQSYDEVFASTDRMPRFPVPEGENADSWLRKEVWRSLEERFNGNIPNEYRARAEYELGVIAQMGFSGYFLVISDTMNYARKNRIRAAPGRGSATGCLCAYVLGITGLDPIEHKLIFERFLNPDRVSMPDIDLDFDERRRGDMIRYATERWGDDRVSQIITFGTIKAKAAIKDACRVLGYPYALGDRITKTMPPPVMGKDIPLAAIFDQTHPQYGEAVEIRALVETDADVSKIVEVARGLEGLIRQPGVHAAGVILSSEPLIDVLPIWRRDDGAIITGWDYPSSESVGLLKMDFLGLRNLTVIDDAIKNVKRNRGIEIDLEKQPLEDTKTFELLARGDTLGVFQLDGGPMRSLLKSMAPSKFEDIAAVLALYRPGPMAANAHIDFADRKTGRKPVVPIHPELEEPLREILEESYGLVVYQEQVMAIAQRVAGYTLGKADLLRRAMGKKKKEILDKEFSFFAEGMRSNGFSGGAIDALWGVLLPFSGYGFNKSHTAGYGLISFWTSFLKANYPAEYMAALLTSVGDDKDKMAIYLAESRRMGIKVLPPDVNESDHEFTPVGEDIRFGLGAVRNVGAGVVRSIVAGRAERGSYVSFADFLQKSDIRVCNKRTIESLIKAGAFDALGHTRKELLRVHESAIDTVVSIKREEAHGQFDLFSPCVDQKNRDESDMPFGLDLKLTDDEWHSKDLLNFEREMLGLYVSSHPLAAAEHLLRKNSDCTILSVIDGNHSDGASVKLTGMIVKVIRKVTKEGKLWAVATLEDLDAGIEVLFFPKSHELFGAKLVEDSVVVVKGRVNIRDGSVSIVGMDIEILDMSQVNEISADPALVVSLIVDSVTPALVADLKQTFLGHRGETPVHLKLQGGQGATVVALSDQFRVSPSGALRGELKALLGVGCIGT